MTNVVGNEKREQILALGRLGWSLRRIEAETGIRRETASAYLKAAGLGVRPPGRWGQGLEDSGAMLATGDQTDVEALLGPVKGVGPTVTRNFLQLRGWVAR
jgi:hypothetical protein